MIEYSSKIIIGICKKLQLQPHLYDLAEQRYHTIASTIQNDAVFSSVDVKMYPHGSFRLKTTVKPLVGNEYDLDFVAELPANASMTPQELYDNIYRILSSDGIHNDMLEKKSRCIRVVYSNDFHIDIMPGKRIDYSSSEIIVPDKGLKSWYHHSNPIGFATWFEEKAKSKISYLLFEQRRNQFSTEPVTDQEIVSHLEPLRRAVQLIKRYRDIYCDVHNAQPVRSIIICTLMGDITSTYSSEIEIISDFCSLVNAKIAASGDHPFEVRNPVVDEVLSEKWIEDKRCYTDFIDMMKQLANDIKKLSQCSNNIEIGLLLQKMFGESITNDVIKEFSQTVSAARTKGVLMVNSQGVLGEKNNGTIVKKNTFYGD